MKRVVLQVWLLACTGSAAAFESNEYREIGNCAMSVAHLMLASYGSKSDVLKQTERLLPKAKSGKAQCELPAHTNGFAEWARKLNRGALPWENDAFGRMNWGGQGQRRRQRDVWTRGRVGGQLCLSGEPAAPGDL